MVLKSYAKLTVTAALAKAIWKLHRLFFSHFWVILHDQGWNENTRENNGNRCVHNDHLNR